MPSTETRPDRKGWLVRVLACAWALLPVFATAASSGPPEQRSGAEAVTTRAVVRSLFREDDGRRTYIRLKLVPHGKLPFTTITYRVLEPKLVAGLREGDSVAFVARRVDGENTLAAIHVVAPCQRFEPCQ